MVTGVLVALLVVAGALALRALLRGRRVTKENGVTYVVGYPIIGCLLDFLPDQFLESISAYAAEYGKFFAVKLLFTRVNIITDVALAKEVLLRRPKQFRRPRNLFEYSGSVLKLNLGLLHSNGQAWSRMRRVTAPSFSSMNISSKLHAIFEELESWMERLGSMSEQQASVDMNEEAFSLTVRVISRAAFGLAPDHPVGAYFFSPTFVSDMRSLFEFSISFTSLRLPVWLWRRSPLFRLEQAAVQAEQRLVVHCQNIMDYKRKLLEEDPAQSSSMIDHLLLRGQGKEGGGLSDEEVLHNVKIFYIGGSDTTAITITWLAFFLSLHPAVQERVRAEAHEHIFQFAVAGKVPHGKFSAALLKDLAYTYAVVKETLRLRNPVSTLPFELEADQDSYTLANGYAVHKGEACWINFDGIMANEEIFPDAQAFKPERWLASTKEMDEAFLCFGHGPRVCPGMMLASVEATLGIAFLAHTFDISLACAPEEVRRVMRITSTPDKMPLRLVRRLA